MTKIKHKRLEQSKVKFVNVIRFRTKQKKIIFFNRVSSSVETFTSYKSIFGANNLVNLGYATDYKVTKGCGKVGKLSYVFPRYRYMKDIL